MENSREGWKNRGIDGSRGGKGSRVLFERFRPLHDTVLKTVSCSGLPKAHATQLATGGTGEEGLRD